MQNEELKRNAEHQARKAQQQQENRQKQKQQQIGSYKLAGYALWFIFVKERVHVFHQLVYLFRVCAVVSTTKTLVFIY